MVAAMSDSHFLRIKRLYGKGIIKAAAKHNLREIVAELGLNKGGHIDPARIKQNIILCGGSTAADVEKEAKFLMENAEIRKLRKDAVIGLEIVFSLPEKTTIQPTTFFEEATSWAQSYLRAPIVSAVIHYDEAAPHCHVLILPLINGRMVGSDLHGGKAKLYAMQSDFHAKVCAKHGLARQAPTKRHSASIRRESIQAAFNILEANSGLQSEIVRVLVEAHFNNPEPLMQVLGLEMPKPTIKGTFVSVMTKPCKPEKLSKSFINQNHIGFANEKPIGFRSEDAPERKQTLSCVGFAEVAMPIHVRINEHTTQNEGDFLRERENEQATKYWDETIGDFIKPPINARSKTAIEKSVNASLFSLNTSNERKRNEQSKQTR